MNATQMARGGRTLIVSAATAGATYKNHSAKGHNAIIIYAFVDGTGQWDITLKGRDYSGNFIDATDYNGNAIAFSNATTSQSRCFKGIPNDFQFVTNEDSGTAALTLSYELLTL